MNIYHLTLGSPCLYKGIPCLIGGITRKKALIVQSDVCSVHGEDHYIEHHRDQAIWVRWSAIKPIPIMEVIGQDERFKAQDITLKMTKGVERAFPSLCYSVGEDCLAIIKEPDELCAYRVLLTNKGYFRAGYTYSTFTACYYLHELLDIMASCNFWMTFVLDKTRRYNLYSNDKINFLK